MEIIKKRQKSSNKKRVGRGFWLQKWCSECREASSSQGSNWTWRAQNQAGEYRKQPSLLQQPGIARHRWWIGKLKLIYHVYIYGFKLFFSAWSKNYLVFNKEYSGSILPKKGLSYTMSSEILELTASDCLELYFTWMRNSINIHSSVIFPCFCWGIFTDFPDRHLY